MEPNNEGLFKMMFLLKQVIFRFQPLISRVMSDFRFYSFKCEADDLVDAI